MEEEMKCALCGKRARMLCESDQAKLCWDCDTIVRGANFLVAKHLRVLLCRLCQSPTPWKASGPSLTPTSSLCHRCDLIPSNPHHGHDHHSYDDEEEPEESDDESDVPEDQEEEEEGENQVVPWSSVSVSDSEAVVGAGSTSGSSDNEGDMSSNAASPASTFPLNRSPHRRNIIHHSDEDYEDEIGCSSSERVPNDESSSMMSMLRPLKKPRMISQRDAAQWHDQRWGRTGI